VKNQQQKEHIFNMLSEAKNSLLLLTNAKVQFRLSRRKTIRLVLLIINNFILYEDYMATKKVKKTEGTVPEKVQEIAEQAQ